MFKKRIVTTIIIIFSLVFIINISRSIILLWQRADLVQIEEQEKKKVEQENLNLKQKLNFMQDPEYIEQEARDKLNMRKPGEAIVVLPEITSVPNPTITPVIPNWQKWRDLYFGK